MCGRITIDIEPSAVAQWLNAEYTQTQPPKPRYNVAPSSQVLVVRTNPDSGKREMIPMRWGFIPAWADDATMGSGNINARSETVYQKKSFCNAIRIRRCIVIVSGFYEWNRHASPKQAYFIHRKDGKPLTMGGIWERNDLMPGGSILSFAVLTTQPNELMEPIHDRMPVIVPEEHFDRWLDPKEIDVADLFGSYPAALMAMNPVSSRVNKAENDGPELLAPVLETAAEEAKPQKPKQAKVSRSRRDAPGQGSLF